MLVLSRRKNQTIEIGDDVVVSVIKISGNAVRLGISAPPAKAIKRGELPPRVARDGAAPVASPEAVAAAE